MYPAHTGVRSAGNRLETILYGFLSSKQGSTEWEEMKREKRTDFYSPSNCCQRILVKLLEKYLPPRSHF
jgi:hypothetical protein